MISLWNIPRDWEGETCAVLACGPSMSKEVADTVRAAGCKTIAVNNVGIDAKTPECRNVPAIAPWADVLYAADNIWWHHNKVAARKFKGLRVTIAPQSFGQAYTNTCDVLYIGNGGQSGIDPRATHVRTGRNSGYQAISIAVKRGAARVLLCGFDMRKVGKRAHYFGDYWFRVGFQSRYNLWIQELQQTAPLWKNAGVKIINCTPDSALTCFPMMSLEDALNGMQELRRAKEEDQSRRAESEGSRREVGNESACVASTGV